MSRELGRRELMGTAGVAAVAAAMGAAQAQPGGTSGMKIIGVSTSARMGKTTAAAVSLCLAAAKEAVDGVETELIELADLSIPAQLAAGQPLREGETDDFPAVAAKLSDPAVAGIIVGSPVYFGNMSALCKAFIDRCITFRKDNFRLRDKVAGIVAVGSTRNGGQELTVQSIQAALQSQDLVVVGTGKPSARIGATLWNRDDTIDGDEFGQGTARDLGRRVAELAARLGR